MDTLGKQTTPPSGYVFQCIKFAVAIFVEISSDHFCQIDFILISGFVENRFYFDQWFRGNFLTVSLTTISQNQLLVRKIQF